MNQVLRVRCGIPDCPWGVQSRYMALNPKVVSDSYALFWDHMVQAHGLNPDTGEVNSGITEAAFHIDLQKGTMTVKLTAKGIETVGG